jgi:hypothetical protein
MLADAALAVLPLEESVVDGVLDGGDVAAGFRGRASVPRPGTIAPFDASPSRLGYSAGPWIT